MDLQVNHRSGGDTWFSDFLDSCREGDMDDEDWRFLHGLPTFHCGSWLPRLKKSLCQQPGCTRFKDRMRKLRLCSASSWMEEVHNKAAISSARFVCRSALADDACFQLRAKQRAFLPSLQA